MNYTLSRAGKDKLAELFSTLVTAHGAVPGEKTFTATPQIEQIIIEKLVEHGSWFYQQFIGPSVLVTQMQGKKILMAVSGGTAGTNATSGINPRKPRDLLGLSDTGYSCQEILNDWLINYSTIDQWSEDPLFAEKYNALLKQAMVDDLLRVGWNGVLRAATSDIVAHPDMSDVAKGWLQKMREFDSGNRYVIGTGGAPVSIGETGTFRSLDALVSDIKFRIPKHKRNNLVCLLSDDLIEPSEAHYYDTTTNKAAEKILLAQNNGVVLETFGGLRAVVPPFFPDSSILVTPMSNLKHYIQRGSMRRTVEDEAKFSAVVEYNSSNQDYVINDEEAAFFVENITIADAV